MRDKTGRLAALAVMGIAGVQLAGIAQSLHPVFDSIGHFRLHLSLLLLPGILLLVILGRWPAALMSAAVLAAGLAMMPQLFQSSALSRDADITLLQFNSLYRNRTPEAILSQVGSTRADVVTLQEILPNTSVILDRLRPEFQSVQFCDFASVGGTAVLSRWPIVDKGCHWGLTWMQVNMAGRPVTFASLHLHWPYPHQQDEQVRSLLPVLRNLPQPVILAGDFNAAPWSHTVVRIAGASSTRPAPGLRLSWMISPSGLGRWPFLPLDHVLLPAGASADVALGDFAGSDHLPVVARIFGVLNHDSIIDH